jgi:hypothetical protein
MDERPCILPVCHQCEPLRRENAELRRQLDAWDVWVEQLEDVYRYHGSGEAAYENTLQVLARRPD